MHLCIKHVLKAVLILFLFGITKSYVQKKIPLSFNDVRLWRNYTIALSDDGNFYTNHYSDKSDMDRDSGFTPMIRNNKYNLNL